MWMDFSWWSALLSSKVISLTFHVGPLSLWNWNLEMLFLFLCYRTRASLLHILMLFCSFSLIVKENPEENPRSVARTNNKLNPYMPPDLNRARDALVWGERSHLCPIPALHDILPVSLSLRSVRGMKLAVVVLLFTYAHEASNIWSTACIGSLPAGNTRILNTYKISLSLSSDLEEQFPTSKLVYVTVCPENVGSHSSLLSIRQSLSSNSAMSLTFMMVMVTVWLSLHTIEPVGVPVEDKSWWIFQIFIMFLYLFVCRVACVRLAVSLGRGQKNVSEPRARLHGSFSRSPAKETGSYAWTEILAFDQIIMLCWRKSDKSVEW